MATLSEVKHYVAMWFMAGKRLYDPDKSELLYTNRVYSWNKSYSKEFETIWENLHPDARLTGSFITISDLLSEDWEIISCARCEIPTPVAVKYINDSVCSCDDLALPPDPFLPKPKPPENERNWLGKLIDKIKNPAEN